MKKLVITAVLLAFVLAPAIGLAQGLPAATPTTTPTAGQNQNATTQTPATNGQSAAKFLTPEQTKQLQDALKKSSASLNQKTATNAVKGGIFLIIVWIVLSVLLFAFWIWMLVDLLLAEFPITVDKAIWAFVIIALMPLGALLYLIIGRPRKRSV